MFPGFHLRYFWYAIWSEGPTVFQSLYKVRYFLRCCGQNIKCICVGSLYIIQKVLFGWSNIELKKLLKCSEMPWESVILFPSISNEEGVLILLLFVEYMILWMLCHIALEFLLFSSENFWQCDFLFTLIRSTILLRYFLKTFLGFGVAVSS